MEVTRESKIIKDAFESQFNKENFYNFINQLLKNIEGTTFIYKGAYIKDDYKDFVKTFERVGKFSTNNKEIDINIENLIYIEFIEEEITLMEQEEIMDSKWFINWTKEYQGINLN